MKEESMKKILFALCMTFVFLFGAHAGEDPFSEADADRDGRIDRQEFNAAVEKKFRSYDLNGDGVLDMEEIRDVRKRHGEWDVGKEFEAMDTNGDGRVDLKEFKESASKRFMEYDRNGDGFLDRPEVDYRGHYQDPQSVSRPFGGFYF
jgi:Ca2+-binding EF-hand superfamily protein